MKYETSIFVNKNRLDIIAKYIYVKAYCENNNLDYARKLYENTVLVTTKGAVIEPDHFKEKHNMKGYVKEFERLIDSIKKYGFDESRSNGSFGAHRIACMLYLGYEEFNSSDNETKESFIDCDDLVFDAQFFINSAFKKEYFKDILIQYIRLQRENIFIQKISDKVLIKENGKVILEIKAKVWEGSDVNLSKLKDEELSEIIDKLEIVFPKGIRKVFLIIKYRLRRVILLALHYLGYIKPIRKIKPDFKYFQR